MLNITTPITESDFKKYYKFRWDLLRKPWAQQFGSEKDDLEQVSIHRMAIINNQVIAVGRLHFVNETTAHVRYMAVDKTFEKRGIGKAIYTALEEEARKKKIKLIVINARETAIVFYEKLGFSVIKKSHALFNMIQHFEMHKHL